MRKFQLGYEMANSPKDQKSNHLLDPRQYADVVENMESVVGTVMVEEDYARLMHSAMGIATEAGELMDQFKRTMFYKTDIDITNVIEELGDILWYVQLACNVLNIDIKDVQQANAKKLMRRYPSEFTTEHAVNRDLHAERQELENSIRQIDGETS